MDIIVFSLILFSCLTNTVNSSTASPLLIDFHRVNQIPVLFDTEEEEKRLTKQDPFLDDFVPLEYITYDLPKPFPTKYPKSFYHLRRLPRDVDSNINIKYEQDLTDDARRTPVNTTITNSRNGNNENSLPNAETLFFIRKEIERLSSKDISKGDRSILEHLNQTMSTAESKTLLELTVALIKIGQRVDSVKEGKGSNMKVKEPAVKQELSQQAEDSQENCKNLKLFKILPGDSEVEVRRKYAGTMMCFMNRNVDPCEDFYTYACGKWNEFHPIPRDKSGYDTFEILREDLNSNLIEMFEEPIDESDGNSSMSAKKLYNSCMNTDVIELRKERPLLDLLDTFGKWPVLEGENWSENEFDWIDTIMKLRLFNNDILIAVWVGPDGKKSDDFILQFDQSDLLLPSSDYYRLGFNHPIMQAYYNMLVDVSTVLGSNPSTAKKDMKDLIAFETSVASIMIPPNLRRNFSEIYNKMSLSELQQQVPAFNFSKFLEPLLPRKLGNNETVVIYAIAYFKKLTELISRTKKRVVANYVLWRFIRHRINNLDHRFEKPQHTLFRMLYGREETPPRKRFCVSYVNGNLGNIVGSMFVRRHFDEQSKRDMEALTKEVQGVFKELVFDADWLSNKTKLLAEDKIKNIVHNIGYPDDLLDEVKLSEEISEIEYGENAFFENVLNNLRARTKREMSRLDKSVNRRLWTTTPAVVNAYYSRNRNQIMFPAAILQPPFYHKYFPKALNYGGIGVVIGHEITHGFDDKGRQFDHVGNIMQWWDMLSFKKFQERKQCIIDQYHDYNVKEVNIYLNGDNTQGENIADNGGIKQAYFAYKNWLRSNNIESEPVMPGMEDFSGDQLFFLNFAQVWCGQTRPEALRSKLKTAVHAPGPYRVLGTLSNSKEFSNAFMCAPGSRMNPKKKCTVW